MTTQPQKLPEHVSAQLKERRLSRGLALETVHRRTRIPVAALEALEENNPSWFSAPVYMHGFLQQYCDYLELDCDSLCTPETAATPENVPPAQTEQPPPPDVRAETRNETRRNASARGGSQPSLFSTETEYVPPRIGAQQHIFRQGEALGYEDFVTSLGGGLARYMTVTCLVLAVSTLWLWRAAATSSQEERSARNARNDPFYEAAFVSTLKASFSSRAWLRVDADGLVVFEGYSPAGAVREWKAARNFSVSTPRPDAVSVTLDNKRIKPEVFAGSHTVIPVTFTGFSL
jgi:hypothetical protein